MQVYVVLGVLLFEQGVFIRMHLFFTLFMHTQVSVNKEIKNYNEFSPLLHSARYILRY